MTLGPPPRSGTRRYLTMFGQTHNTSVQRAGISRRSILAVVTDDELFEAIGAYRSRLVDQLESLTDSQWRAPSLCEGWEVRHVVGHLVSVITVPTWRFIVGSVGMSGFHRKVDRFAREFGEFDRSDLIARYRALVASRRAPARIGPMAPLMDVTVHSLDVGKPLGLPSILDDRAASAVLTAMSEGFPVMAPRSRSEGLRLEANDLEWASGSGALIRGAAGDLALAISGRRRALDDLEGDGVDVLRRRLQK
jgi:uncharacterized protein (TIGR03083 family)